MLADGLPSRQGRKSNHDNQLHGWYTGARATRPDRELLGIHLPRADERFGPRARLAQRGHPMSLSPAALLSETEER
jgi:hypothetical protein